MLNLQRMLNTSSYRQSDIEFESMTNIIMVISAVDVYSLVNLITLLTLNFFFEHHIKSVKLILKNDDVNFSMSLEALGSNKFL